MIALDRSSAGDPARTLALLWREDLVASRRGPARGLDLDRVVVAATALADRDGLVALTIRRVAQSLGVAPMTLYTYAPSKAELLDLMLDMSYAQMPRADTTGQPWRERLTALAEENQALFEAHPWAVDVSTLRPPLGPGLINKYEHELSAFDGLGLSDVERDDSLTYLLEFVRAAARATLSALTAQRDSAQDDAQWWASAGPLLARVMSKDAYPLATRIGAAAGVAHGSAHDPSHAYRFGLGRTLDGLGVLIDRAAHAPNAATPPSPAN